MTLNQILEKLRGVQSSIEAWPAIDTTQPQNELMQMIDQRFDSIQVTLDQIYSSSRNLSLYEKQQLRPALSELQLFIQSRFQEANNELNDVKQKLGNGRTHVKAIRAYNQPR